jgi:hypothetical protein
MKYRFNPLPQFLDLHKGDNLKLVTTTTFAGQAYRTIFCVSLQSAS